MKTVHIFTDGACRGNPGPGGWGAVLQYGDKQKTLKGALAETTNNRMELMAAIRALEHLQCPSRAVVTTDSRYVQNGINGWIEKWKHSGWKTASKKPVKNIDLWKRLDALNTIHEVSWHWVKGHSGHLGNEQADDLANQAIDEMHSTKEQFNAPDYS